MKRIEIFYDGNVIMILRGESVIYSGIERSYYGLPSTVINALERELGFDQEDDEQ